MNGGRHGFVPFALAAALILALSIVRFEPSGDTSPVQAFAPGQQLDDVTLDELVDSGQVSEEQADELADAGAVADPAGGDGAVQGQAPARDDGGQQAGQAGGGVVSDDGTDSQGPGSETEGPGGGGSLACEAGRNGGSTDVGVTGSEIKVATTAALDGPASSLLADSVTAMSAVFDQVNQAGGICGRRISLKVDNDGFNASRGSQLIRNYTESGDVFALPVVPSAEGLGSAIENGTITNAGMPVVGTDGLRREQYGNPWVWPVATSTTSTMRVMADYGFRERGARTFAIIYDRQYKFGVEGKDAFVNQVNALGGEVVTEVGVQPDEPGYGTQITGFNGDCGDAKCDMVAFLLLPDTMSTLLQAKPEFGNRYTAAAQTLFTDQFATACVQNKGAQCDGVEVWTGYNPPIGSLASKPGVADYVRTVRAKKSNIDVNNQFVEGAYLGASVFVEALEQVGPNLTQARLRAVLDQMTYQTDLTSTLKWVSGNHRANISARSFAMKVSGGAFQDWATSSGFRQDPNPEAG